MAQLNAAFSWKGSRTLERICYMIPVMGCRCSISVIDLRKTMSAFLAFLTLLLTAPCPLPGQGAPANLPRVTLPQAADLIYSTRPDDPWNTIFAFLFSRHLQVRLSQEFPEGAPFVDIGREIQISKKVFERDENGDRAIEPLYPTFFVGFGSMLVLRDPVYSEFSESLKSALADNSSRSAIARAMMQNDLWGAYDALSFAFLPDDEKALGERRKSVVALVGRFIRKIALTSEEIRALPENYSAAARRQSLPDVFGEDSGWMEVEWFLPRQHDQEAGFRKVSRVFVKPAHTPLDKKKFLNSLTDDPTKPASLGGVALLTQLILLDSRGNPQPTRLTVEAQARLFDWNQGGRLKTTVKVCEISRKLFLKEPNLGGLVAEAEWTPAYLSNGGSYGFAEGQLMPGHQSEITEPIQVRLRTRCAACHGKDLQQLMTFSIARPPNSSLPPVKQLNPAETRAADFDISEKRKRQTFKALFEYFHASTGS